jgi:acyl-CoA synthetase (AMP-forming)/AMP-acid ligase II
VNLADALDIHARARPTHVTLIDGARRITCAEAARSVRDLASRLVALPEDAPVGVCLRDTAEHVLVLYALARAGRVILPMDVRWTEAERQNVASHFGASLVLLEPDMPRLPGLRCVTVAEVSGWPAQDVAFTQDENAPFLLSLSSGTTGRPKGPLIAHRH